MSSAPFVIAPCEMQSRVVLRYRVLYSYIIPGQNIAFISRDSVYSMPMSCSPRTCSIPALTDSGMTILSHANNTPSSVLILSHMVQYVITYSGMDLLDYDKPFTTN